MAATQVVGRKRAKRISVSHGAEHPAGLWLIAAFKLLKGVGLLIIGIGAHHMMHRDMAVAVEHWVNMLRVDQHNYWIHRLVAKLSSVDARRLRELSFGTFFYAALLLTEGVGLALRLRWAEYMTVISTSALIPLEVYELLKHYTALRIGLLLINLAVVAYLIVEMRRPRGAK